MASARPTVSVFGNDGKAKEQVKMPAVFVAPIRPDIVASVHTSMAKNRRQPYAVRDMAGMKHSAESWGTGRAVARIPRISGGGTSRSGQGAFGNQCRKGRMYAPTKIWRKWHRKINVNQKRYAVASALAASALPSLVAARGHKIDEVPEIPLVVDSAAEKVTKTKDALKLLKALGANVDVEKAKASRKLRAGTGKLRGRRHVQRRGPLVVYNKNNGVVQAMRNLPGVDLVKVDALNLLQLAPGGHMGRFVVWTKDAFNKLHNIFGSVTRESGVKKGFHLPVGAMTNSDITRIINSDEVQTKVRAAKKVVRRSRQKKNPLTNFGVKVRLNPYALSLRRAELLQQERSKAAKAAKLEAVRKGLPPARTSAEAKKRAKNLLHEKRQKLNFKRIVDGANPTKDDNKKAAFDSKKFNALKKNLKVGSATTAPKAGKKAKAAGVVPKFLAKKLKFFASEKVAKIARAKALAVEKKKAAAAAKAKPAAAAKPAGKPAPKK